MNRDLWTVAQIGAREHYAIARGLHKRGLLKKLYTDAWVSRFRSALHALPDPLYSLANRYHPDLPDRSVHHFTLQSVLSRAIFEIAGASGNEALYEHYRAAGEAFACRVRDHLLSQSPNPERSVFFGYDTGSLEVLQALKNTDWITVVDQIDDGKVGKRIVAQEIERWPGWATSVPVLHERYDRRRYREWQEADIVVVNSEWSKRALLEQDVEERKIFVIPLAYEKKNYSMRERKHSVSRAEPLRILWLGSVTLRKGIQYLLSAAQELTSEPVHIDVVGSVGITEGPVSKSASNVTFHGRVPRNQTSLFYERSDVFVLPTLSDGFALTQVEAMAHGLPVIATRHCGRVVNHKKNGLLIPTRSPEAIVRAITYFLKNPSACREMGFRAIETAKKYTIEQALQRLRTAVAQKQKE